MELFEPQNFFQMAGLIGGAIGACIAIAGLSIAASTLKVAIDAKNEWVSQRKFDFKVTVHSLLDDYINLLDDIYNYDNNYTAVFVDGFSKFRYRGVAYEEIGKSHPYFKSIIQYTNHTLHSQSLYSSKIEDIYNRLIPSVVGLNDNNLNILFQKIKNFRYKFDHQIERSKSFLAFLATIYSNEGRLNQEVVDSHSLNHYDYIKSKEYVDDLVEIKMLSEKFLSK